MMVMVMIPMMILIMMMVILMNMMVIMIMNMMILMMMMLMMIVIISCDDNHHSFNNRFIICRFHSVNLTVIMSVLMIQNVPPLMVHHQWHQYVLGVLLYMMQVR